MNNPNAVICPKCITEFIAIPENIQNKIYGHGCLFAGPDRGDCEHFIKELEPTDEYGRPEDWCEVCWRGLQIQKLKNERSAA